MINHKKKTTTSLGTRILTTFIFIAFVMLIPTIYANIIATMHLNQYDTIITNVSRANQINKIVREKLSIELWDIVSGTIRFDKGKQYDMLREVESGIDSMLSQATTPSSRRELEVAKRTLETLRRNIAELGKQIENGARVSSNEEELDEIRGIISLLSNILQNFIVGEIEAAAITNASIRRGYSTLTLILAIILLLVLVVSFCQIISISNGIKGPISDMENLSSKIAGGNLAVRVSEPSIIELSQLARNMNIMAGKIKELIAQNIEEQKNLQKAEMKLLQAQITPHFLYNTLDTIIWLAEEEETEEVIKVTCAFSEFLRISLSRGHEWITVQQELEHVKHYLTIQKVRYSSILNYEIESETELNSYCILKLTLQPLIENAIYHGIKNKRGRGHIKLVARYSDGTKDFMTFSIEDDGAGFSRQRLSEVQEELKNSQKDAETLTSVYGLYNVNKRLILYYNNLTDGIHIESTEGQGTKVYFTIPCKTSLSQSQRGNNVQRFYS